ncbi:hypothetical protein KIW84_042036 [Lathyrus oleraceus]|uniref:Uncharacterized protein n=1 Tax=Pisum sativum TaxID=3888 RepID=A0A9D4XBY1_PEA|nr:hypothetical protein KIW84_042036 [Pisum sativum]
MTQAFNKKVKKRVYQIGDLVIKRIILPQSDPRGKWTPTYEGPFVVKKVFSGGAMILATMDGESVYGIGIGGPEVFQRRNSAFCRVLAQELLFGLR